MELEQKTGLRLSGERVNEALHRHPPLKRMLAGFKVFRTLYYEQRPERIQPLVNGEQEPRVLLIACSDSRVDPAILTNAEPGELFVVRNIANLVPPYQPDGGCHGTSAAIEFAVTALKVEHIVILGHSGCGGLKSLAENMKDGHRSGQFVGPWMEQASQCCCGQEAALDMEQLSILGSLDNLMTFPFVKKAVEEGKLTLNGWWFEMTKAILWGVDLDNRKFVELNT